MRKANRQRLYDKADAHTGDIYTGVCMYRDRETVRRGLSRHGWSMRIEPHTRDAVYVNFCAVRKTDKINEQYDSIAQI